MSIETLNGAKVESPSGRNLPTGREPKIVDIKVLDLWLIFVQSSKCKVVFTLICMSMDMTVIDYDVIPFSIPFNLSQ